MKILSLNMHCGMETDYDDKLKIIAGLIDHEQVDLILLQECVQEIEGKILFQWRGVEIKEGNLAWRLIQNLADNYDWYFNWGKYGFEKFEEGMAVLSRKPMTTYETRIISKSQDIQSWKTRLIMAVDVEDVRFYNIHMGWWDDLEDPFGDQLDKLMAWSREDDLPKCFIGDFNAPAGGKAYDYMLDLGLEDLYYRANPQGFDHETFIVSDHKLGLELDNANQRIDHVMGFGLQKKVNITRIFTGVDLPVVSDHYGLLIDLS